MNNTFNIAPCPVPKDALLFRGSFGWGFVTVHEIVFYSTLLAFLRDRFRKSASVTVAIIPDDLSRAWVFDPFRMEWTVANILFPGTFKGMTIDARLARRKTRKPSHLRKT
jgi:hypothetical protein